MNKKGRKRSKIAIFDKYQRFLTVFVLFWVKFGVLTAAAWIQKEGVLQTISKLEASNFKTDKARYDLIRYNIFGEFAYKTSKSFYINSSFVGVQKNKPYRGKNYGFVEFINPMHKWRLMSGNNAYLSVAAGIFAGGDRNEVAVGEVVGRQQTMAEGRVLLGWSRNSKIFYIGDQAVKGFFVNSEFAYRFGSRNIWQFFRGGGVKKPFDYDIDMVNLDIAAGYSLPSNVTFLWQFFAIWQVYPNSFVGKNCINQGVFCSAIGRNTYKSFSFNRGNLYTIQPSIVMNAFKNSRLEVGFNGQTGGNMSRDNISFFVSLWNYMI